MACKGGERMTCEDNCLHWEVCRLTPPEYATAKYYTFCNCAEKCECFKDKSKYIELPCGLEDTVYRIQEPWGLATLKVAGIHLFWNKMPTRVKRHSYIVGLHEGLNLTCRLPLDNFGKIVFLTKSEAEQKLKELNANG